MAAGVIALTQAAVGIGKGIRFLQSLKDVPVEYKDLLDELSNLHLITDHIQAVLKQFQSIKPSKLDSKLRLARVECGIITSLTDDLSKVTNDLNDLCDRLKKTPRRVYEDGQPRHQRVSKYEWQKEKRSLDMLRSKARTTREFLTLCFSVLTSSSR